MITCPFRVCRMRTARSRSFNGMTSLRGAQPGQVLQEALTQAGFKKDEQVVVLSVKDFEALAGLKFEDGS